MHYTEDKGRDMKNQNTGHRWSDIFPKLSITDMEKYISKRSEMSVLEKCVSSILVPWTQVKLQAESKKCSMTSQKGFIFSEPAL